MSVEKLGKNCELCIRDENNLIVAWQVGMSEEDIDDMLKLHNKYNNKTLSPLFL